MLPSHRLNAALIAVVALVLVGAMASLAAGRGPLPGLLGKARDTSHARKGTGPRLHTSSKVSTSRLSSGTRDRTAPETTISSGPAATTTETAAGLVFASNESGSTFSCKLDAARWSRCKPPKSYTGLAVGAHQFAVRAADKSGNVDATPAVWSWSVVAVTPPAQEQPAEEPPVQQPPAEEPPVEQPPVEEPPADTTPPETTIQGGPGHHHRAHREL